MKRIAFFGMGIFGAGPTGRGIPSLRLLLRNLSDRHCVTFYRLGSGQRPADSGAIRIRMSPNKLSTRVNYLFVIFRFMVDHLRHRYHIIHALSPAPAGRMAVWLGRMFNVPVVIHLHSGEAVAYPEFQYGDLLEPKLKEIIRRVCNRADAITVLSHFQKDLAMKNLALSKEPIVIPRGLDIREFPYKQESNAKVLRLLYIGYPEKVKDPEGAVRVFQMICQKVTASLTMVGDGLNADYFSGLLTDEHRKGITFMGALPYQELKKIYASVDLLLVTSRYESQSAVALEAMACGVLVCGTHVGILADLSGKACATVAPQDYTAMTEEILNLWGDASRKKSLRETARHWVGEHDVNWTSSQYEDLMNKLVE